MQSCRWSLSQSSQAMPESRHCCQHADCSNGWGSVTTTSLTVSSAPTSKCMRQPGRRHLMLATDQQLQFLTRAKTWYIDGTFKLRRHPFSQFLTPHPSNRTTTPSRCRYCLWSYRGERKTTKVFKQLLQILPLAPAVKQITIDYENAIWAALSMPTGQASRLRLYGGERWDFNIFLNAYIDARMTGRTVEPPLTDTSRRWTPLVSGHLVMFPATYKHYIFNLP